MFDVGAVELSFKIAFITFFSKSASGSSCDDFRANEDKPEIITGEI